MLALPLFNNYLIFIANNVYRAHFLSAASDGKVVIAKIIMFKIINIFKMQHASQ